MPTLAINKRANFDYEISETFEAGLVLAGHETKSAKAGQISLKGAYITLKRTGKPLPDVYLTNAHISAYKKAGPMPDYEPTRPRKLLIKKREVKHLIGKKQEQGLTLVPIKMYTKRGLVKLEFGIGKGKKKADKREAIKKREVDRQIRTLKKQELRR